MATIIEGLFTGPAIQALGWTIIHSFWQLTALAIVLFAVIKVYNGASSQWKYTAGIVALGFAVIISTITFIVVFQSLGAPPVIPAGTVEAAITGSSTSPDAASLWLLFKRLADRHMQFVVFLWVTGVVFLIGRMAGGLLYNRRLKTKSLSLASDFWQERLNKLCHRAGSPKFVILKESLLAKVPMTIGYLKPVILFPVGVLSGLPQEQVEALLAHELAHIVRSDYLVNMFQGFVDIFYFYHPAVHWISGLIRQEREHCSDDMAVELMGDTFQFARALANVHAWGNQRAIFAMKLAKNQHKLLNRIRRIINMKKEGTHSFEGFVGACVLGVLLIITGFSVGAAGVLNGNSEIAPPVSLVKKTIIQKEDKNHILEMRAAGEAGDIVKLVITETSSGRIIWEMTQKLLSESFAMQTEIMLKKGEYSLAYTPNLELKLGSVGEAATKSNEEIQKYKKFLVEYNVRIKKLEDKGEELTPKEKEELDHLRKKAHQIKDQIMIHYKTRGGKLSLEEKKQLKDTQRQKELELKLKKVTTLIDELETKEGKLNEEEQEKLVKLRKSRDAIAAAIKR